MKVAKQKRILAYLLDFFIVLILCNLISSVLPTAAKLEKISGEMNEVLEEFSTKSKLDDETVDKINDISYRVAKVSVLDNAVSLGIYLLYFILFQYYNKGQTLGKRFFKVQVLKDDDSDVDFKSMLVRGIILYAFIFKIANMLAASFFPKNIYLLVCDPIILLQYGIFGLCGLSLIFTNKSIHDRFSKTKVIYLLDDEEDTGIAKWNNKNDNKEREEVAELKKHHTQSKKGKDNNERINRTRISKKK